MAASESEKFIQKLHSLDQSKLKCIKFREGCLYYGQVELVEITANQLIENSKLEISHIPAAKEVPKEVAKTGKAKDEKGKGKEPQKDTATEEQVLPENMKWQRHGLGVQMYYRPDGTILAKYEGSWFRGKKQGHAVVTYPDKSTYVGNFKNDCRDGKGIFRWANGYTYDGDWKEDKMEGLGSIISPKGEIISSNFRSNGINAKKGIYLNPFLAEKDFKELLDKREEAIQKAAKAATPSEKGLVFETIGTLDRARAIIEFSKEKGRVPLFLSTR